MELYYEIRALICTFDNTKDISFQLETIDKMINKDISVLYKCDDSGFTLLRIACILLHIDIIKLILNYDIKSEIIKIKDNNDFTVLHSVCSRKIKDSKLIDIVRLLLNKESSSEFIRIKCYNGFTALDFAYSQNNIDIIRLLLDKDLSSNLLKIKDNKD